MQWPRIFTAMVTPFTPEGHLDEDQAEQLSRWLVDHGTDGLMIAGTTGESPSLTQDERKRLYLAARRAVGNEVPVWVGTGSNNTEHSREMSLEAAEWGADGVLLVCPYYNKPPQEGLYRHFVRIAQDISVPVMLYNVPGRTGVNLEPITARRVMDTCPNVQAIKEASGSLAQIHQMVDLCPEALIYSGDDALFYPALAMGAHGVVSVASHVVGDQMRELWQSYAGGNTDVARTWHSRLLPVFQELFSMANPIPLKWMMNRLGMNVGPVRLPLVYPADPQALRGLVAAMDDLLAEGFTNFGAKNGGASCVS